MGFRLSARRRHLAGLDKYINEQFAEVPPEVTNMITCTNAGKFYGLINCGCEPINLPGGPGFSEFAMLLIATKFRGASEMTRCVNLRFFPASVDVVCVPLRRL